MIASMLAMFIYLCKHSVSVACVLMCRHTHTCICVLCRHAHTCVHHSVSALGVEVATTGERSCENEPGLPTRTYIEHGGYQGFVMASMLAT